MLSPVSLKVKFDGAELLREQSQLLASANPSDISSTTFLRVRLAAQQKRTQQRNQLYSQRGTSAMSSTELQDSSMVGEEGTFPMQGGAYGSGRGEAMTNSSFHGAPLSRSVSQQRHEDSLAPPHHTDPYRGPSQNNSSRNPLDEVAATATGKREELPEVENVVLVPCPHCGRSFAEGRIKKHCSLCIMNGSKMDHDRNRRKQQQTSSRRDTSGRGDSVETSGTDWRWESSQLRGALNGEPLDDKRVPCPYCHRRFQADTAAHHIPLCKDKMMRL